MASFGNIASLCGKQRMETVLEMMSLLEMSQSNKFVEEVKNQTWLAGPLVSVNLLQICLQMVAVMFVGHLGQLVLSCFSMSSSAFV